MHTATILLGSNIEPEINLPKALELIKQFCTILQASRVWETEAIGSQGPDFLNAAIEIETQLTTDELKFSVLRRIEQQLGRIRGMDKYADRRIDLDIIIYDNLVIDEGLWQRSFIAAPVSDLHPFLKCGGETKTLLEIASELQRNAYARIYKKGEFLLN
jgi:2-amino-4-hydroxy-6-hydroxymethyldihydropteridine diphosphokinase